MPTPTQFPTWATTANGQAVFVPDQVSFNQALKPVAQGGIGATWSTSTAAVTRSLGPGATLTVTQARLSDEQTDGRAPGAAGHGGTRGS
jgi:hypothetical protein